MTNFPSLKDDLKPRVGLKKNERGKLSDREVEANSRQLSQKWVAPSAEPTAGKASAPPARVVSIRGYIPDYLDQEMTVKAAQLRVTKTFLLMEALAQAGYRVDPIDLNQDRRRNKA